MIEFIIGFLLGQNRRLPPARPSLHPGGHLRYRPLQAWSYAVGRALGRLVRSVT